MFWNRGKSEISGGNASLALRGWTPLLIIAEFVSLLRAQLQTQISALSGIWIPSDQLTVELTTTTRTTHLLISAFGVFLSMWTQGQVHVLNSGHSVELDCEFYAEEFSMFNNPVMWKKYQRQDQMELNIMGNILPPFLATGRFHVTLTKSPPRYTLKLRITGELDISA